MLVPAGISIIAFNELELLIIFSFCWKSHPYKMNAIRKRNNIFHLYFIVKNSY